MTAWQLRWYLPVGALAFIALAVWTSDPGLAALLGGLAGTAAAVFLVLVVLEQVRFEGIPLPDPDADPLVVLTRSFRGGRFGREEILSRLDGFELALGIPDRISPAETDVVLAASDREFLDHVERRLDRVEGLS